MKFDPLIPELTAKDIEATKAFCVGVLRFRVEYERPEDKFAFLSLEGDQLMFRQENGSRSVRPLEHPYGRGVNFEMTVSDVRALYGRIPENRIVPFRELKRSRCRSGSE